MPANPKYLTASKRQRFAKASASILGGFLVAASFHLALAAWLPDRKNIFATYSFSLFLVWMGLMFIPYLMKNGWTCWLWYGSITLFFSVIIYLAESSTI
ncbi:MAG: hypothetical protein AAF944_11465 [Bacteroidota bacterium]